MIKLVYPEPSFKIKREGERARIFDRVRKKWVSLSPEEWVRQNFIAYLISEKLYPPAFFSIEKEILFNGLRKRCDVVVFYNNAPFMVVECKELNVPITETVLRQVLMYNMKLDVPFLLLTNGSFTYGWRREGHAALPITEIPSWTEVPQFLNS